MLVDTHAHLYWESYKQDFDEMIQRALNNKVGTIINVGVDVKLSKIAANQVLNTLSKIPNLKSYSTIGIHPHEAARYVNNLNLLDEEITHLEKIHSQFKNQIVAIGECGLDYLYNPEFIPPSTTLEEIKQVQKKLFAVQINLAKKLKLPLIIHVRDDRSKDPQNSECWDEALDMIENHPTILHCYSGLMATTKKVLNLPNVLVSFAATLTYPRNDYLKAAVKLLPLEKIVLETDCPFLPPQSKRGQRNEPANIIEIAQMITEIKNISFEQVAKQTTANVRKIFAF